MSGLVSSVSGDNKIEGNATGKVTTVSGDNKIKGTVGDNTVEKKASRGAFFKSEVVVNGQRYTSSGGGISIINGRVVHL